LTLTFRRQLRPDEYGAADGFCRSAAATAASNCASSATSSVPIGDPASVERRAPVVNGMRPATPSRASPHAASRRQLGSGRRSRDHVIFTTSAW